MSGARTEFGIICDRMHLGLGKALISVAYTPEAAWAHADGKCPVKTEHYHRLHERQAIYGDWSDAVDEQGMKEAQVMGP